MCKTKLLRIWLLFSLVPLLPAQETLGHDARMGNLYLEQARFLLKYEDYATAAYFIDKGREYIPESRELHYLSNLLLLKTGEIKPLLTALGEGPVNIEPHKGDDLLTLPLLGQTKRYDQVLAIYERWESVADWKPREVETVARAMASLDRAAEARRLLRESLLFYPLDEGLTRLLMELSPEYRAAWGARLWSGGYLSRDRENRILLMLLPFLEGEEFLRGWKLYQERGLFSLEAEIRRGELLGWDFADIFPSLLEGGLFYDGVLSARVRKLLLFNEDRDLYHRHFFRFSGSMTYDVNRDGFPEITATYHQGVLTELSEDRDQNGEAEKVLILLEGKPRRLLLSDQGAEVEYQFYPWVERVVHHVEQRRVEYYLSEEQLSLSVSGWEDSPVFPHISVSLDWEQIYRHSRSILASLPDQDAGRQSFRVVWGNKGETTLDNVVGGPRRILSRDGLIYREERYILERANPDTIVVYQEGTVREIHHDADGNGVFEYSEIYPESSENGEYRIIWDMDQDGRADVEETVRSGSRIRAYLGAGDEKVEIIFPQELP